MLNSFKKYVKTEGLFQPEDSVLLAVSGGIDSVMMVDLFAKANFKFAMVHCNFSLREEESDADEEFVRALAKKYDVSLYCRRFDTEAFARENRISIQMAARELRYKWFESLRRKYQYKYIATGHHKSDVIETVLINFLRGTGIAGLHGMKAKRGSLIRPILFAGKEEIHDYVKENNIHFRQDSSNLSSKYLRNKLRLEVIPLLKEINVDLEATVLKNISNIEMVESFVEDRVRYIEQVIAKQNGSTYKVSIEGLLKNDHPDFILYEILKKFGFTAHDTDLIFKGRTKQSGKSYFSAEYRLIKDRDFWIITPILLQDDLLKKLDLSISDKADFYELGSYNIMTSIHSEWELNDNKRIAFLDYDKLSFPLKIKAWKKGDKMKPLGMSNFKKLSDYFVDEKVPLHEKEQAMVLWSGEDIAWLLGHRIDERYKVGENTKKVFRIQLIDKLESI